LKSLIQYRLFQKNNKDSTISAIYPNDKNVENPQQMLQLLALLSEASPAQLSAAIPYQLQNFLQSKEAFALPFLAIGWTEAALQLHALEKFPDQFPSWIAESVTRAIAQNRNSQSALEFALNQKSSPVLSLLIAETALAADEKHIAFNTLKEIYTRNDESGRRAALILGQFLLDHDNISDAKKALLAQPALANDTTAGEILARIAIQEGDLKKAYILYLGIEKNSSEAKSFLARKAFSEKEWSRARELTVALLKEHPENPLLTDNLQKIIAEEKKTQKPKNQFKS
jgi:predicted Zn-dependent protease